uniref:Uncharacterized protein n=1 Tax=Oryza nivara TaxID=4536 RepID=A0A0E0G5B8_ORYNI
MTPPPRLLALLRCALRLPTLPPSRPPSSSRGPDPSSIPPIPPPPPPRRRWFHVVVVVARSRPAVHRAVTDPAIPHTGLPHPDGPIPAARRRRRAGDDWWGE